MRVLALGGAGFIGRHAVQALIRAGHTVIIGSRRPTRVSQRLPRQAAGCERRLIRFEHLLTASAWKSTLVGIDTVLNCVGILRSRPGESYDCVHHQAVAALADACIECGIRRLVHVSALGLHPHAASGFLRSKWHGELSLIHI